MRHKIVLFLFICSFSLSGMDVPEKSLTLGSSRVKRDLKRVGRPSKKVRGLKSSSRTKRDLPNLNEPSHKKKKHYQNSALQLLKKYAPAPRASYAEKECYSILGKRMLFAAIQKSDIEDVKALSTRVWVNCYDVTLKRRPLEWAATFDNKDVVEVLIKAGAKVNGSHGEGLPLLAAAKEGSLMAARQLLKLGAKPNLKPRYENSPMVYAIESKNASMVKLLLEYGVNPNELFYWCDAKEQSYNDTTSSYLGIALRYKDVPTIKALVNAGAQIVYSHCSRIGGPKHTINLLTKVKDPTIMNLLLPRD